MDQPDACNVTAPRVYTATHDNETHANAVDCSLIEMSKENIQPLRRGRDPHQLIKVLGHTNTTSKDANAAAPAAANGTAAGCAVVRSESSLKAERKSLEAAIKSYSGPSPLEPWLAYIRWTQQSYLTTSLASHLVPLLEKCTRTFLRDDRVRHSLAYLQIWFQYMDCVEDSLDMFAFLHANGVGVKHAQLFEGWSMVLERRGRVQDAQDALQLGINSGAQPKWRLKNAVERLQARVAKGISDAIAADPNAFAAGGSAVVATAGSHEQRVAAAAQRLADENGSTVRQPLQRIGAAREPVFERPVNGQTVYAPTTVSGVARPAAASGFAAARARHAATNSTASAPTSNFQVFCDGDLPATAAPTAAPFASFVPPAAAAGSVPVWNEFASAATVGKENRAKIGSWSDPLVAPVPGAEPLAEGSVVTLPPCVHSDVPVFMDPECAALDAHNRAAAASDEAAAIAGSNPRKRLDGPLKATTDKAGHVSLAKLASNPLRNMNKPSSSSSSSSSSSAAASSAASK